MSQEVWTVMPLIRAAAGYLEGRGVEEPRLNAERLLASVLGLKRLDLYLQFERPVTPEERAQLRGLVRRRARGEPLQYLEGDVAFRDLTLRVDPRVLIPRPETETLISEVLTWVGSRTNLRALDLGTGSGAIALALATEGPFREVVATDISPEALALAGENRESVNPPVPVTFRVGALFEPVAGQQFDVIVSNPPYVAETERVALAPEVAVWEPPAALFAGPSGFEVLLRIIAEAPRYGRPGGLLALEVGRGQAGEVADRIRTTPGYAEPMIRHDLAGAERFILAEFFDGLQGDDHGSNTEQSTGGGTPHLPDR